MAIGRAVKILGRTASRMGIAGQRVGQAAGGTGDWGKAAKSIGNIGRSAVKQTGNDPAAGLLAGGAVAGGAGYLMGRRRRYDKGDVWPNPDSAVASLEYKAFHYPKVF